MVRGVLLLPLVAALALPSAAQTTSSSSSSSAASVSTAEELAQDWFTSNFDDNDTQLAVGIYSELADVPTKDAICSNAPSLQRRTVETAPNGGCPDIFTAVNASCSCLSDYASDDGATWEFRVMKRSEDDDGSYATTLSAADALPIDYIRSLLVPSTLTTLRIIGVGDIPQSISFLPEDQDIPGSTLPIALNAEDTNEDTAITTVEIVNINMSSITQTASTFMPSNAINITLRNCGLVKFGYNFMKGLDNVQYFDMSSNYLTAAYAGSSIQSTCSNQLCAVEILNLTSNHISTFPEVVFNLENLRELYLADNLITDFNISESVYESILALEAFTSDATNETTTCTSGEWKSAHNSTFCVVTSSGSTTTVTSSSGTKTWVYVVIGVCAAILIVAGIVIHQRYIRYRKQSNFSKSFDSEMGDTFNFDDTLEHVDSIFLNDPVIITNRIEYKHLKVGKCISQGGFGLVFAGEYHGRRVAIKKIRPDRSNEVREIEQFLKEIILMAQLYHPRIVEFIGVAWDVLRHLTAVNEFMDNGDLRNVLHGFKQQGTRLTWVAHKARLSLHVAEALEYLHSLQPKVIHRDLKSKNVLVNMHMDAKLSDFGISRQRFRVETHMTVGIGTSFWIAPEVLLGRDYDERADIFSFGVVLSEIDTDDYPYWNDANAGSGEARGQLQEAEILSLVAAGKKRPGFSDDCPAGILDLADRCLQKEPEDRPSAAEIVVVLRQLTDEGLGLGRASSSSSNSSTALLGA